MYQEMRIYKHDAGHMTKIATMPIYGKNPSKISGTSGPISMKLDKIVCSNYDPGLTLTFFMAR